MNGLGEFLFRANPDVVGKLVADLVRGLQAEHERIRPKSPPPRSQQLADVGRVERREAAVENVA